MVAFSLTSFRDSRAIIKFFSDFSLKIPLFELFIGIRESAQLPN
jgi:hypothetical protein